MDVNKERTKLLGEEPIGRLLLKFSIPAIVGMLVNALYNVVDRIFIGRGVGQLAIGGLYIAFPINLITMAFAMLIGIGGNSLVSIRLGQKRRKDAEQIIGNAITALLGIGIIISLLGLIFLKPLLIAFGASETILPYSYDYMKIILLGVPLHVIGFGLNNFIRGEGNPKIAMGTMLIGAITNIILDPIFIFVFNMGVKGAALATIIAQALSGAWVLRYFLYGNSLLKIKKKNLRLKRSILKEIVSIGFAPFGMQIGASMVTVILNNSLRVYGGDIANASMGVIHSISTLMVMPIFGINQGSQPIIGFNYGAEKYHRVIKTLKLAILAATSILTIGFIVTQLFPETLIRLFLENEEELSEILGVATKGLRIYLATLPIIGFQIVSSNYFQATGKPKHSMFLSLSRQVLILIPALLILPKMFSLTGVWLAAPTSDILASITTGIFLARDLRKLNNGINIKNKIIEEP